MKPRNAGVAQTNGMDLAYEDFGPEDGVPLILIMGLGAQLVFWPDALVGRLVGEGFRAIRFDNRDIGLSTKLHGQGVPKLPWLILRALIGFPPRVPYLLTDMARDTVGLMDALGIERAHIVGASMGGMIAQLVAIHFPERVLTLTSIMSTTGSRRLPRPDRELLQLLAGPRPATDDRAALIEAGVHLVKAIGTPDNGASDDERRALVTRAIDRGYYPEGPQRQLAAIIASGSRRKPLRRVKAPTLVLHGTADRLVPPAGGKDTAKRVPGARLEWLEGMGHDLPGAYIPRIAALIAQHAKQVR